MFLSKKNVDFRNLLLVFSKFVLLKIDKNLFP